MTTRVELWDNDSPVVSAVRYRAQPAARELASSDDERRLLAQLDEPALLRELVLRTGLNVETVTELLAVLEHRGAVSVEDGDAPVSPPAGRRPQTRPARPVQQPLDLPDGVEPWSGEDMADGISSVAPPELRGAERDADLEEHDGASDESAEPDEEEPDSSPEVPDAAREAADRNYRLLYERDLRPLETDARIARARVANDAELLALCFDPDPKVVAALLENTAFGPVAARLVAAHHTNARGLEILARRLDLLRDAQVQRGLLKNGQLPDGVLSRIIGTKPLRDVYRFSVDRDVPERTRLRVRAQLRVSFSRSEPEERAALLIKTEGRALMHLSGCTFDSRTTQMLCARSMFSALFIQNLARFGATPPLLLSKLVQLPNVRRQPQLRALLLRHSNMPSEVKRRV